MKNDAIFSATEISSIFKGYGFLSVAKKYG